MRHVQAILKVHGDTSLGGSQEVKPKGIYAEPKHLAPLPTGRGRHFHCFFESFRRLSGKWSHVRLDNGHQVQGWPEGQEDASTLYSE